MDTYYLWGKKKMDFKDYKLQGRCAKTHVTRRSELPSDPRTKSSRLKLWKGLFQKAAGQNFLTRTVLNVWEKPKSKAKQAKTAKGNN